MPFKPALPQPSNPDTPRSIQASEHPSIPDCRNPLFDHLKGVTVSPSRGRQGSTGDVSQANPEPPHPTPGPQIGAPACTGVPNSSFDRHPSIQASNHPCLRSQRSAAEAVAYKYIYIYIYIYICVRRPPFRGCHQAAGGTKLMILSAVLIRFQFILSSVLLRCSF